MLGTRTYVRLPLAIALACALVAPSTGMFGAAGAPATTLKVGMNLSSVDTLTSLGAKPDYATFWVGIWTKKDWSDVDDQLRSAKSKGVTPFIQWYYWGDDISPSCVEKGCWSSLHGGWKSKSDWNSMAVTLAKKIRYVMGDAPVVVNLETEFNKGGIQTYEAFDGYLAAQASTFRTYAPNAKLVLGFGNWGWQYYKNFDRAIAKVDYLGFQELLGSTRDSDDKYWNGVDRILSAARYLRDNFDKPSFLTDTGFSSYPDSKYAYYQEHVVKELFARLDDLADAGVHAWMYRSVRDNPGMDPANYYGYAERYWGFIRSDGSWKPSMNDYVAGVKALRAGSTASKVPSTLQVESFDSRSVGGVVSDASAWNGKAYNLWANGYVAEQVYASAGDAYSFQVRAKGTPANGAWPTFALSVGGTEIARWTVSSREYRTFTATTWLPANTEKQLKITYVNDLRTATEDRNLIVDAVVTWANMGGSREAEAMRYRTAGGRYSDAAASGGAAWGLWTEGNVRDVMPIEKAGKYAVNVKARGSPAAGVQPVMVVSVDGKEIGRANVREGYATYTFESPWLAAWNHGVRVAFVNDGRSEKEDRNLIVDRVDWSLI